MKLKEIQQMISTMYGDDRATPSAYIACGQALREHELSMPEYVRTVRVALLSSYTILGLADILKARGLFHNLNIVSYTAPYNQYTQEILNVKSPLYASAPDLIYLLIDACDVSDVEHLSSIIKAACVYGCGKVCITRFVESFVVSSDTVHALNTALHNLESIYPQLSIFNFDDFLARIGTEAYWYTKYTALGDMRLTVQAFPALAEELLAHAVAFSGATKKCLVLDLDNTLWKGIVGEEGSEGVIPDRALQSHILSLHARGVLLALNSKNNKDDAFEVIDNHLDMLLRGNHFAACRINWEDKARNMEELARELNLGLDSFVFLDDSSFEQARVRESFPEVAVVPIGMIRNYAGFATGSLTKEDMERNAMYQSEQKRAHLQESLSSVDDFLKQLQLHVVIRELTDETLPRMSQLTQKTNQFNLTTRRYSEHDLARFRSEGWCLWTIAAEDRFGKYGIIGVALVEPKEDFWRLDTFLLSCRILGRGIEKTFMAFIIDEAKKQGVSRVQGEFIKTKKNELSALFLKDMGFVLEKDEGTRHVYEYATMQPVLYSDFIEMT